MKVTLYYFSGTGNTQLICNSMKEEFKKANYSVNLIPIENAKPNLLPQADIYGIAFPIAIHTTYPFVRRFIEALPLNEAHSIFALSTMAGTRTGLFNYFLNLQKKRNFQILGLKNIRMPNNYFPKQIIVEENEKRIERGIESAEKFAQDIITREIFKYKKDFLSRLFNPVGNSKWLWTLIKKMYNFKIVEDKCKICQICIKGCPTKNFELIENQVLRKNNCELCLRCLALCPNQAIQVNKKSFVIYKRNREQLMENFKEKIILTSSVID
ncbi:EFR1 family ferrodoxin [Candidatus Lokiarchaeum ossiferum]|uniref:EFR1 family ferrodoxin n=1 Tax=Candidatus Lokiarchaeum ossiferum TaxID=2951803 RepID=UPI00352D4190